MNPSRQHSCSSNQSTALTATSQINTMQNSVLVCKFVLNYDGFNEAMAEEAKAVKEAEQRTKEFQELKARLDSFEQAEHFRKEHEAEYKDTIKEVKDTIKETISRMDNMVLKMYELNPKMSSLPTKELEDTFLSTIEDKKNEKQKKQQNV